MASQASEVIVWSLVYDRLDKRGRDNEGELADAAGRDPIFIEKINWSFPTEFAGSREQPCARYALRTTERRRWKTLTLLRADGPVRVEVVLRIIP
jgi:hypothetical protein